MRIFLSFVVIDANFECDEFWFYRIRIVSLKGTI